MNQAKAMEWVAALRSGQYAQDKGYLHTEQGFCCLGVACDLYKAEVGLEWKKEDTSCYDFGGQAGALPGVVANLMGMRDVPGEPTSGPVVIDGISYPALAQANDAGVSFAKIADWIEQNWEKL